MKQKLIKFLSIILAAAMIICTAPAAEFFDGFAPKAEAAASGTCGENVYWNLDEETGTLTISGNGAMTDWSSSLKVPWADYCKAINSVTISDGVTNIGDCAFEDCSSVTQFVIPESITIIGKSAFEKCTALSEIEIPYGTTSIGYRAFCECANLISINISDSVTNIGDNAFIDCEVLESITSGSSIAVIGYNAFFDCTNITDVYYNGTESEWNAIAIDDGNECFINTTVHFIDTPIEPHEHSYSSSVTTPATCTKNGVMTYTCECGSSYAEVITATGHKNTTWITNKEATCSQTGIKQEYCLDCDTWLDYETISKTEHSPSNDWVNDTQPTCTTEGKKVKKCTVCGEAAEEQIIPANGHMPTGDWITETSPSCEGAGRKVKYCSVCKEIAEEILIDPTGHQSSTEWIIRKDATCTENGIHYKKCTVCGMDAEIKEIPALGHDIPSEWTVTKKATCTESGTKIRKCTRCDKTETEIIPAKGHTDGAWIITSDADCTNPGIKIKACTACGLKTASSVIPPKGHVSGEWEITERATCSKEGSRIKRCTRCNTVLQSESIPVTSHEKGNWIVIKAPSGGSYGIKAKFCIGCGIKMEEKIFHSISNSVVKDNETGIEILYPDDSFDGTMSINARVIPGTEIGGDVYDEFGTCNFIGYEAILIDDGEAVTPSKSYSLKLPVPNGFNYKSAEVYAITSSGSFSKVTPTYENGSFTINNVEAVKYVIIEKIITLSLSETSLSMNKGNSVQLYVETNATGVTYTSSNPDVAVVDENGIVTAVGSGVAVITAKADGSDVKDECHVEVTQNFFEMIMAAISEAFSSFFRAITDLFKSLNGTLS